MLMLRYKGKHQDQLHLILPCLYKQDTFLPFDLTSAQDYHREPRYTLIGTPDKLKSSHPTHNAFL
jgi:hypothetical protein